MDYRNLESTQATINSYLQAFNKMKAYCDNVECSSNEFNFRSVLPTQWKPTNISNEAFRKDADYLHATHASLMDFGRPRIIEPTYFDYREFFKVSWQIRFPFDIYAWELGRSYTNKRGKTTTTPTKLVTWCSPQYLCLGEISSWSMKSWALPDWWVKHEEIFKFMDDNANLKEQYKEAVSKADEEVKRWQQGVQGLKQLTDIFDSNIAKTQARA